MEKERAKIENILHVFDLIKDKTNSKNGNKAAEIIFEVWGCFQNEELEHMENN